MPVYHCFSLPQMCGRTQPETANRSVRRMKPMSAENSGEYPDTLTPSPSLRVLRAIST